MRPQPQGVLNPLHEGQPPATFGGKEAVRRVEAGPAPEPPLRDAPRADHRQEKAGCRHVLNCSTVCELCGSTAGLDVAGLADAVTVAEEGRKIAERGIRWIVDGIIPDYGMLGMLVAYAKVGKTTFAQALGAAVSRGQPFLGRHTTQARVLLIAAEDPPEYVAYLARHLVTEPGQMVFFRRSIVLDADGLRRIAATVIKDGFGLALLSSWQHMIRGLVNDENDNAGAVLVVENVKATVRETGIPWLIDAHAGKGEDQSDDADPSKALRGASAAAAAADFTLSLRYADGAFGSRRRLSGKGRFVMVAPETLSYDDANGAYESLGHTKDAAREATWRQIVETGAITTEPRTDAAIAKAAGLAPADGKVAGAARKRVREALRDREGVIRAEVPGRGRGGKTVVFSLESPSEEEGERRGTGDPESPTRPIPP